MPLHRVCYSADLGFRKHDVRFFETASQHLGVSVAERSSVVFVDDVLNNVEVARSFGWRAVHASPDARWHSEVAEQLGLGDR